MSHLFFNVAFSRTINYTIYELCRMIQLILLAYIYSFLCNKIKISYYLLNIETILPGKNNTVIIYSKYNMKQMNSTINLIYTKSISFKVGAEYK